MGNEQATKKTYNKSVETNFGETTNEFGKILWFLWVAGLGLWATNSFRYISFLYSTNKYRSAVENLKALIEFNFESKNYSKIIDNCVTLQKFLKDDYKNFSYDYTEATFKLGKVYSITKTYDNARDKLFESYVEIERHYNGKPELFENLYYLGKTYYDKKKYCISLKSYLNALNHTISSNLKNKLKIKNLMYIGLNYYYLNDFNKAKEYLSLSMKERENANNASVKSYFTTFFHLSMCELKENKTENALKSFKLIVELADLKKIYDNLYVLQSIQKVLNILREQKDENEIAQFEEKISKFK